MKQQDYWNRFVSTGCVSDYLLYRRAADRDEEPSSEADDRRTGDMGGQDR